MIDDGQGVMLWGYRDIIQSKKCVMDDVLPNSTDPIECSTRAGEEYPTSCLQIKEVLHVGAMTSSALSSKIK